MPIPITVIRQDPNTALVILRFSDNCMLVKNYEILWSKTFPFILHQQNQRIDDVDDVRYGMHKKSDNQETKSPKRGLFETTAYKF